MHIKQVERLSIKIPDAQICSFDLPAQSADL